MLNDNDFKVTLIKAMEQKANNEIYYGTDNIWEIIMSFPRCNVFIEETGIFTRREWNTYCAVLHIQAPIEKQDIFNKEKDSILEIAKKIYGKQGDHYLTNIEIGILMENYEVIDFSTISLTEVISRAIADAEIFMGQGLYDSAFDRVHTAFHGYMRKILDNKEVTYEESDTLSQLYNKLHSFIGQDIYSSEISILIKTTMRSASGVISSINDIRNRHSLAHPNEVLLSDREAKLVIKLIKDLTDYINEIV